MPLAPSSSFLCHQLETLLRSLDDLQASISLSVDLPADAPTETPTLESDVPLAEPSVTTLNPEAIHQQVVQVQQPFQQLLQAVAQADLDLAVGQRLRAYQTEAHRRLRLLGVEAMKLRTAKQAITLARSQSQLQDHLAQLRQFMQAIADEVCSS